MALDEATVARVATLARIKLEAAELAPLARELSSILGWIEQLSEVDTDGVEPMTSVAAMKLPWRVDAVTDGGDRAAILANGPDATEAFFVVPKVVE